MKTARTKIDVFKGKLSMELEGEVIHFDNFKAMKHRDLGTKIQVIDVIDGLVEENDLYNGKDHLEFVINRGIL